MQTCKSFQQIIPSPVMLASKVGHQLLERVILGIAVQTDKSGIKSAQDLNWEAMRSGRGEAFVKADPEFRAAQWLLV